MTPRANNARAAVSGEMSPPTPMDRSLLSEPLLTPEDVSVLLGVKRATIYELTRARRLPHVKVGRATRFLRADLEHWLNEQRGG